MLFFSFSCSIVCLLLGSGLIRLARQKMHRASSVRQHGVVVQGHVISRAKGVVGRGATWYYLTYRYAHDGVSQERTQPVWQQYYLSHEVGAPVPVYYLPHQPEVAILVEDAFSEASTFSWAVGGWTFIAMGVLTLAIAIMVGFYA